MGFFSFLKGKTQTFPDKSEIEANLSGVDFELARDEIANIFHIGIEEGKKKGESLIAKKEFVEAWEKFRVTPCLETAVNLLEVSPIFQEIFEKSKPGGMYWFYKSPAVSGLGKIIIDGVYYCAESFKEDLKHNLPSGKEVNANYIQLYFEFFYFFMHMHNRTMFSVVGFDERRKFNEYFGELMLKSIVESIVGHWPQELKEGITRDVLNNLDSAEVEYSTSKTMLWNKDVELDSIIGDSILAKLTRNIASHCGYEMVEYNPGIYITKNPVDIMDVSLKVSAAYIYVMDEMKLQSIMKEVADAIKNKC